MSDLKEKMTEMSGLFSNKKLNVVDESGSFVRSSTRGEGGGGEYSTNFYTGRLRPEVQLLYSFIYSFLRKRFPFRIPSLDKWGPFH